MGKAVVDHDFTITWGVPFRLPFTWENADATPVDISLYPTARAEIRPAPGDSHLVAAFDSADLAALGRIELGGAAGTITLVLDEPDTWAVTRGGTWDLFLYPADGADIPPVKFAEGKVSIDKSTTRRPA